MPGDIEGPTVIIGADASGIDSVIQGIPSKFDGLANNANTALSKIGKGIDLSHVSKQIDQVAGRVKELGTTLTIAALPFEAFGVLAVKAFTEFEQGIGKIGTLLPEATKAEMDQIGSNIKEFSAQYGADLAAATQAYYDALSAGVSQENVLPFMEVAQKAGVAGISDVSVATDGLTSILNAYQMQTSEASNVSDQMFKTVELGKIEFDELANNIGKVAPVAAQFKVGFDDVGAAIAAITSQGLGPEQTMTVLTSLISQLGMSGTELSDKFLEITGKTFPEFIAGGGTLAEAIGKIREDSQSSGTALMDMTGNLEAAKALAMLGGPAFEQYSGFLDKVANSAGATDAAYAKMSDTLAFSTQQLQTQIQLMQVEVGEALAPTVKEFTQWLRDNSEDIKNFAVSVAENAVPAIEGLFDVLKKGMDAFNGLSPDTKSLLAKLLGVGAVGAAVGGPALFTAGTVLGPVSTLVGMLGKLQVPSNIAGEIGGIGAAAGIAAGSSGVGGLTAAISALGGPVGIGAVLAVSAGIAAYATNFGDFATNVNSVVEELGSAAQNIQTGDYEAAGRDAAEAFAGGFETAADLIVAVVGSLPSAVSGVGSFISGAQDAGRQFGEGIGQGAVEGVASLSGPVADAIRLITSENAAKNEIPAAIREWFSGFTLESEGSALGQSLVSGFIGVNFSPLSDVIVGAISGAAETGVSILKEKMSELYGISVEQMNSELEKHGIIGKTIADAGRGEDQSGGSNYDLARDRAIKAGIERGLTPYAAEQEYYNNRAAHSGGYGSQSDLKSAVQEGTAAGMKQSGQSAPVGQSAAEILAKERDLRLEDAQKMLDSSADLRAKYESQAATQTTANKATEASTAAANDFTKSLNTASQAASAPAQPQTNPDGSAFSGPGSSRAIDDFTVDPSRYFNEKLNKAAKQAGFDTVSDFEAYLGEYGKTLKDKAREYFAEEKSAGLGGNWDFDAWYSEASKGISPATGAINSFVQSLSSFGLTADQAAVMQQKYNDIARDGVAANGEAVDYLARFKQQTGDLTQYTQQNITETQGLLQAMIQAGQAQDQYTKYMSDGSLSAQEAADMNSRLAEINRLLGDAGVTATGGVDGLPPALQSLATYATNAAAQINNAIQSANAAVASAQSYINQARSYVGQFQADPSVKKSSLADKYNITVSGNTFGSTTTAGKIVSDILNGNRAAGY